MEELYESLLDREIQCECGRKHYVPIKKVMISKGVLNQLNEILLQLGFTDHFHIVADKNTYEVAANRVEKLLIEHSRKISMTLFEEEDLVASESNVLKIKKDIDPRVTLIIAVGSGTINDLSRYAAFQLEKPYLIIATAPSMDGYASSVSPLIINGFKNTFNAVSPIAIIGDTEILKNAPVQMIAAGFGDLIGKYISLSDWKLSNLLNEEYYCEYVASIVHKSLILCIDNIKELKERSEESIANLMNGLILSGLGMLMTGNSRPASGAEHHLSHFWEMKFLIEGKKQLLHGQKVGVSTVLIAKLYNSLKMANLSDIIKNQSDKRHLSVEETKEKIRLVFESIAEEVINENFSQAVVSRNVNKLKEKWKEILEIANEVPDSKVIKSMLDFIDAPSTPDQLNIDKTLLDEGLENCMYVRNRYTILRLFDELSLS